MKSREAERTLRQRLGESPLTPQAAVEQMVTFYRDVRADDCDVDQDGSDMLLVQWGTYDWGDGDHFSFNVTRQFITGPGEDEDIWQLGLTFRYPPEPSLVSLGAGNRWCHRPADLGKFKQFIEQNPAFHAVKARRDASVEIQFGPAG